jgi:mRNA-degrading endonuclease RelE of RelBE toxin-antitoxin system
MNVRPLIREVVVSRHFVRDLKNEEEMNSIIRDILDCSSLEFTELHEFEENLDGNLIFRAKRRGMHVVYCVDKKLRIIFLRAIKNYTEYKRFLEDKKEITKMVSHA